MLFLDGIGKTYPNGVHALEGVTLKVDFGEILAIVGGSGCGKSTLLRIVSGLDQPTAGRVRLDGAQVTGPHEKIGIVFQEPRLFPWLTIAQNVAFGLAERPRAERERRVREALARVGLADKAEAWPKELSGGQSQRSAIARSLVNRPEVLLLDEPFSALDAFTRIDLQDHLLDLWSRTTPKPTLVIVTHDVEEAVALADRVVIMRPHPGRVQGEVPLDLPRPRDRQSSAFERAKREVLSRLKASHLLHDIAPGD